MKSKRYRVLCFLLLLTIIFFVTACNGNRIIEKEKGEILQDGIKYIVINKVNKKGTVLDEYAKVIQYIGDKENITIPSTINDIKVKNIGDGAFINSNIRGVEIEEGVERIESYSFAYAKSLIMVELPSSTVYIGDYAFADCLALKRVSLLSRQKPILGKGVFTFFDKKAKEYRVNTLLDIYVPAKEDYYSEDKKDNWTQYQNNLRE